MIKDCSKHAKTVALIYPSHLSEDISLIMYYAKVLTQLGLRVILGSPENLEFKDNSLYLFGNKIDLLYRHYKTDWWGEEFLPLMSIIIVLIKSRFLTPYKSLQNYL